MLKDITPIAGEPFTYARVIFPVCWGSEVCRNLRIDIPVPDALPRDEAEPHVVAMAQRLFERDFGGSLTTAELGNAIAEMTIEWGAHHAIA